MATSSAELVMYCPANVAEFSGGMRGIWVIVNKVCRMAYTRLRLSWKEMTNDANRSSEQWLYNDNDKLDVFPTIYSPFLHCTHQSFLLSCTLHHAFMFVDITQHWECLPNVTSCKIGEDEQKRFEVRRCAWAGVVRPLSSHCGSDCCMMAILNSMGQQAVMVDRVAVM